MTSAWPATPPTAAQRAAYADAEPRPFWLDELPARGPHPPLIGTVEADLCIVGGGFTGLWAALHAKADDPARDVVVLEAETAGFGASGRNGGFAVASLTHGIANGIARFPERWTTLERLGLRELRRGSSRTSSASASTASSSRPATCASLLEPHEVRGLEEERGAAARASGTTSSCSTRERCAPRSTRRCTSAALWDRTGVGARRTRASSRRLRARGAAGAACGCTSTARAAS